MTLRSAWHELLRHGLVPLVVLLGATSCQEAAKTDVQRAQKAETAQARAERSPCDLLQAVAGALRRSSGDVAAGGGWSISFDGGCCTERSKVELRAALVGFQFVPRPDLIGWNVRCPAGIGGPETVKNGELRFHYLELRAKDAATLAFALVPASRSFDANGNKVNEVLQGCPDVTGLAAVKD